ncbi:MAG: coproporphyrinogen III oxidase [Alphaproteobacteria bacterium]|nr:coproporphyrinogen III oxidase [Alphaproteobacteria bacterium]
MIGESSFGIYVHWPFCTRKCPYCDFNSHVRSQVDEEGWRDAIVREIASVAATVQGPRTEVATIFFGGGTPSLMEGKTAGTILDAIASHWPVSSDVEITLEANPSSAEGSRFRDYRAAGVNRLSLGVQALNDADLKFLGRLHSVAEAMTALDFATRTFSRVSLDLIYARPGQSEAQWREELGCAMALGTSHLSLYQLTVEPETPFAQMHRAGHLTLPDEELAAALYEATQEVTSAAGLPAYEVSNHARSGDEARHNLLYWRYGAFAGVGPGAHGRLHQDGEVIATSNEKLPERWRENIARSGSAALERRALSKAEAAKEQLLMQMRLTEGVEIARYEERWDTDLDRQALCGLEREGLVTHSDGRVAATTRGRLVLNSVIAALAA